MNETIYVVDNNALLRIKGGRIRSEFFRRYCRVTADVLLEVGSHPDRAQLEESALERTIWMFECVRDVMALEQPGAVDLVDLYKNKGKADPGLLASILVEQAAAMGTFFADDWVVVTADRAVVRRAHKLGIDSLTPDELAQLIDASQPLNLNA